MLEYIYVMYTYVYVTVCMHACVHAARCVRGRVRAIMHVRSYVRTHMHQPRTNSLGTFVSDVTDSVFVPVF